MEAPLSLVVALVTACGFPPPPGLPDAPDVDDGGDMSSDAPPPPPQGCDGDEGCSGATPFCIDRVCAVCRVSTTCPASAPICDETSHDCRECVKDNDCDSGACDLPAGTCVERAAILYAAPGGLNADPCTRTAPCSLSKAADSIDATHLYIVLLPGTHTSTPYFTELSPVVVGGGATIQATVFVTGTASVQMRDFKLADGSPEGSSLPTPGELQGASAGITVSGTGGLTIDDVHSTWRDTAIRGEPVTIRHSSFMRGAVAGDVVAIDRSIFAAGAGVFTAGIVEITNSIFISPPGSIRSLIRLDASGGTISTIRQNTFVGGTIECAAGKRAKFKENIFFNMASIMSTDVCTFDYNLLFPNVAVMGSSNTTGDPKFVDAAMNDFHLEPGSPAIDSTDPNSETSEGHDYDGRPRPQGQRPDMGAFEYSP